MLTYILLRAHHEPHTHDSCLGEAWRPANKHNPINLRLGNISILKNTFNGTQRKALMIFLSKKVSEVAFCPRPLNCHHFCQLKLTSPNSGGLRALYPLAGDTEPSP